MKKFLLLSILALSIKINAQIDTIPVSGTAWTDSTITTAFAGSNGQIAIGYTTGLKIYNGTSWNTYHTANSGIPDNHVNAITQDNNGNYWIGTDNGLAKFDGTNWTSYNTSNSGIADNLINCLATDSSANIWIGTNNGLSRFNNNSWQTISSSNSQLNTDNIRCLAFTDRLYAGTNTGITTLSLAGITNYAGPYNINEIVTGSDTVWVRNPAGIYYFSGGQFIRMEDAFATCPLQKWLMCSDKPSMVSGINGGITFFYAQILMNFNNDSLSRERMINFYNFHYRILRKGNYYYTIELSDTNNLNVVRIDASETGQDKFSIADYFGNCPSGNLNANKVSALLLDRADAFWDLNGAPQYEVPKGSGSMAISASSLWIGGKVNGQVRTACQTFRQGGFDYWPGPLDTVTASNGNLSNSIPIIKASNETIQEFITNFNNGNVQSGTYTPAPFIINWPAHGNGNFSRHIAPFEDVNGNGVYDPLTGGDYPLIKGDQMLFQIYNDASGQHLETGGNKAPMGLEIRQSSYAYNCDYLPDSMQALNYTTFFDYTIINRSDTLIDSMYIGYWSDVSLGNNYDDYAGCNVTNNYAFVYNGDNYDEDTNGVIGYHNSLPCLAISILKSPEALPNDQQDNDHDGLIDETGEETALSSFIAYSETDTANGNPVAQSDFYELLKGRWKNGNTVMYGSNGISGTQPTRYMYPGSSDPYGYGLGGSVANPVTAPAWTEINASNNAGDRKFVLSSGPFRLQAKDTVHVCYAIVFTPATSGMAIAQNEEDVARVRNWYLQNNFPVCTENPVALNSTTSSNNNILVYPNPASSFVIIKTNDESYNGIEIVDVLGRSVFSDNTFNKSAQISIEGLHAGLYFIKVKSKTAQQTFRLIKE